MNGKRLLIVAALAAFASFAAPAAYAATLSNTVPIQVKWNTQAIGSLVLHTNYVPATGLHSAAAQTIFLNNQGGSGTCPATGSTNVDGTVDFGAVSADIADTTNCQYINAVNAIITTADPGGYTLGEFATAPLPAGYNICLLQNGTWNNNSALPIAGAAAAQSENATCTSGGAQTAFAVTNIASPGTTLKTNAAATATTEMGMDLELVIGPSAATGAGTVTIDYTLTLN